MQTRRKRLLITGGSGILGNYLSRMATASFEVYATYNSHPGHVPDCKLVPMDIRDKQRVSSQIAEIKPTHVIHTAALTEVDYCQNHSNEAYAINVAGTENVALASKEVGAKFIYISTDSVFDGKKGMYAEEDVTNPINIYAATKLQAEKIAQGWLPDSVIVRTAFYGWSRAGTNKVSLAKWVVSELRQRRNLNMFTDVFFSPILADNLSEALIEICSSNLTGIYNVAGSERCSKYDFGLEIAQVFGLDEKLIRPSIISDMGLKAPRPQDISLDVTKIHNVIGTRLHGVTEGLVRFRDSEVIFNGA